MGSCPDTDIDPLNLFKNIPYKFDTGKTVIKIVPLNFQKGEYNTSSLKLM